METNNYKKSVLIKLYLKLLLKYPQVLLSTEIDSDLYKNEVYTIKELILERRKIKTAFDEFEDMTEEELIDNNILYYDLYEYYNEFIEKIDLNTIKLDEEIEAIRKLEEEKKNLSYEEMFDKTHDFYNSIPDKEINKIFNKVYKDRKNNIRKTDNNSYTICFPIINKYLINLDSEQENSELIFDLIHEYGHTIQTTLNPEIKYYGADYYPIELMPVFFNLLSIDYFKDEENIKTDLERHWQLLYLITFLINVNVTKGIEVIGQVISGDRITNIYKDSNILQTYSYLIPMLTSFELYLNYKNDPEKEIYKLKNLIGNKPFSTNLKENDIELGKNTESVIKMLKR